MSATVTPFIASMQDAAVALRPPAGGPEWLAAARRDALDAFLQRGLPDTHDELWKYTSLRALAQRRYASAAATPAPVDASAWEIPGVEGPRIVFVNGMFRSDLSALEGLPEGVTLQPLSQALLQQPEPLRFLLGGRTEDDDGFTLLNRALASDGTIVRIAAGVTAGEPLRIVHAAAPGEAAAWHLRNLIEIGAGAELEVIEQHVGAPDAAHLANVVTTVDLRDRARLRWTLVQTAGVEATLLRRTDCRLGEAAGVDFHALELGGKLARHELRVDLAGARARFGSHGAFVLHGRQHADTEVLVTHRGRDTVSDALWRGVADGRARGVMHGRILVLAGADGADGSFYNKNLLLSPTAEIDTRPALEIYADEVQANHGAAVGQLDENVLFYLQSRGIPVDAARRILVRAFCAAALDGIDCVPLRERCDALLTEQLPEAAA